MLLGQSKSDCIVLWRMMLPAGEEQTEQELVLGRESSVYFCLQTFKVEDRSITLSPDLHSWCLGAAAPYDCVVRVARE
ncbi:unnamed protein product [Calypogeia fissa]